MKRFLSIALLAVLTATVGHAAGDNEVVAGGVVYSYNNGTYTVTGWDEETPIQSLHILGELDDGMVEAIADDAFSDNDDIIYLTIDEGITVIGNDAFNGCSNIELAILPEGLVTIGERAFAFCESLSEFVIPSTVREIRAQAFLGCTGVTDVYFLIDDAAALMADPATNSDAFVWWDGWYQNIYESSDSHGGIEFNASRLPYVGDDPNIEHNPESGTMIHVPQDMAEVYEESGKLEAWLFDEDVQECRPLWWIVNYGVVGRDYTVCDDLLGICVDVEGGLYAKDDNHWLAPDRAYPGEIDYMRTTGLMKEKDNKYDQSNWVVLRNVTNPMALGHHVKVTGTLLDKRNPVIDVTSLTVTDPDQEPVVYTPNVYIPCAFMGRAQQGGDGKVYSFVQPKPQELITVDWAICNGDGEFYIVAPPQDEDEGGNMQQLCGGFSVGYDLCEQSPVPEPEPGGHYRFTAIVRCNVTPPEASTLKATATLRNESPVYDPYVDGGLSRRFIVYPLELPDQPLPTAVTAIETDNDGKTQQWFSIDGRLLGNETPKTRGIYINAKRKVVIQ